jgi:hypothetical protein
MMLAGGLNSSLSWDASPALAYQGSVAGTIRFSRDSLVTRTPFQLTLTSLAGGSIKYTTNGSIPTALSMAYQGPIAVNEPLVIRAQVFNAAGAPLGGVYTKSYMVVPYDQTIPVISIVAEQSHLDQLQGFPEGRGLEWERPMNMEYFAPGGAVQFNVPAGIRIHGGFSRIYNPKKSFRIYFRQEYGGPGKLEYPLFADSLVTKFDKLILRAGFQDSFTHRGIPERADRHTTAAYIRDQVVRDLHRNMGQPIIHGSWVLLYLNGRYWGIYNMLERFDDEYLQEYYGPDADWDIIAKENGWDENGAWFSIEEAKIGDYGAWLENQNWIGTADFSIPENIGVLEWRVDIENIFSYLFVEAYVQNTEWPSANWFVYRRKDPGAIDNQAKWRMMVWDAEDSFGGGEWGQSDINTLVKVHSLHDSITRILEKPFIRNCAFKHRFVQRAREYLGVENSTGRPKTEVGQLAPEQVKAEIMTQANMVRPFMQMEAERWAPDLSVGHFDQSIQQMLRFVDIRHDVILHHLDILRYQTFTECQ